MTRVTIAIWIVPVLIIGLLITAASTLEPERELIAQNGDGNGNGALESISDFDGDDGTYEGTASGYHDDVELAVTVEGGEIVEIDVISQSERDDLWEEVWGSLPDEIISEQSTDVDTVSGATGTSNAVRDAVLAALGSE